MNQTVTVHPDQIVARNSGNGSTIIGFHAPGENLFLHITGSDSDERDRNLARLVTVVTAVAKRAGLICRCGGSDGLEWCGELIGWAHGGCAADYARDVTEAG